MPAITDLPPPSGLQATVIDRNVGLYWTWAPPDPGPEFSKLGYEIFRDSAIIASVARTAYTDFDVGPGSHAYQVRAWGDIGTGKREVRHLSNWSEPAEVVVQLTCLGPPSILVNVQPTKSSYPEVLALRLHFVGDVRVPEGCHVGSVSYQIDSGMGLPRTGELAVDAAGHFDNLADAQGPEDEPIEGQATFTVTVTAHDEAGTTTSNAYTIDLKQENPYAPKRHPED